MSNSARLHNPGTTGYPVTQPYGKIKAILSEIGLERNIHTQRIIYAYKEKDGSLGMPTRNKQHN